MVMTGVVAEAASNASMCCTHQRKLPVIRGVENPAKTHGDTLAQETQNDDDDKERRSLEQTNERRNGDNNKTVTTAHRKLQMQQRVMHAVLLGDFSSTLCKDLFCISAAKCSASMLSNGSIGAPLQEMEMMATI
eukprot:1969520-Amphidinium_carterae.2